MAVIQEISVRIGLITGKSMGEVLKEKYSKNIAIIVYPIASLLLIANTINIGADIGAMAASVKLIFPQTPTIAATLSFTAFILASEILLPYEKYVKILKYLILSLFVYIFTAVIVGGNITQVLFASIIPHIEFTKEYAMMFVAVFGTSISPYVFFWQASEEAEEDVAKNKIKEIGKGKPKITRREIKLMRIDVAFGMAFSKLIMWTIIITTAGSLHTHGLTDIQTSEQAAKALEPLVRTFRIHVKYQNNFCFGHNWYWAVGCTCISWFLWVYVIRCIWLERGSEQKIQTS